MLRQLAPEGPADLVALLVEVVSIARIAYPWREARIGLAQTWSREAPVMLSSGRCYPAVVRVAHNGQWSADVEGEDATLHPSPEAARDHCDTRLRARRWLLL